MLKMMPFQRERRQGVEEEGLLFRGPRCTRRSHIETLVIHILCKLSSREFTPHNDLYWWYRCRRAVSLSGTKFINLKCLQMRSISKKKGKGQYPSSLVHVSYDAANSCPPTFTTTTCRASSSSLLLLHYSSRA